MVTSGTASPEGASGDLDQQGTQPVAGSETRRFITVAKGYWSGRRRPWLLVGGIAVVLAATLAVNFGYNFWNRVFFDAIGAKDANSLWRSVVWLPGLIVVGASLAAAMAWLKSTLQLGWRAYVTRAFLARWLGEQRYYRMALAQSSVQNVEHRIAEDVRLATEPAVELTVGFVWSIANSLMFLGVLLAVGGSATVGSVTIPGYLAIAALFYAACVTGLVMWIGRHMTGAVAAKNECEAQFRYELTRIRENAESIAFLRGDSREQKAAHGNFTSLAAAARFLIRQNCKVTWLLNANSFLAPAVPAILAAPKFMSGELTLGAVMQVVAAFAAVLGALNWIADNFVRLAELKAAVNRAAELHRALDEVDAYRLTESSMRPTPDASPRAEGGIQLRDVTLRKQDGTPLVERANINVAPGERVLIEGKSGSGKSTLLRMLAGFWPWAEGNLAMPEASKIAFIPQRPYVPIGRLIDALSYPADRSIDPETAAAALRATGLEHLADKLEEKQSWDTILSGGERQRLAFARVLLDKPDIVVLDEATSALDDDGQEKLFEALLEALPDAMLLNVAHRKGLHQYHDRKLVIEAAGGEIKLASRMLGRARINRVATVLRRGVDTLSGRRHRAR